jgi:hypothetical protein
VETNIREVSIHLQLSSALGDGVGYVPITDALADGLIYISAVNTYRTPSKPIGSKGFNRKQPIRPTQLRLAVGPQLIGVQTAL